jgi:uncharacterized protein
VLLAAPGVRGDELLAEQITAMSEAEGLSHEAAVQLGNRKRASLKVYEAEGDPSKLREKLLAVMPKEEIDAQWGMLMTPWFRHFMEYDPGVDLRKVTCPVLALNGAKDAQVVAKQNLPAIRKALEAGGNKRFETVEMPGLNHLFQTAKTGSITEYFHIDETMAPAVLAKIADWILHHS